jgi:hypothetical protein
MARSRIKRRSPHHHLATRAARPVQTLLLSGASYSIIVLAAVLGFPVQSTAKFRAAGQNQFAEVA